MAWWPNFVASLVPSRRSCPSRGFCQGPLTVAFDKRNGVLLRQAGVLATAFPLPKHLQHGTSLHSSSARGMAIAAQSRSGVFDRDQGAEQGSARVTSSRAL